MSLSTLKKRKIDNENRQFSKEWTEKYLFTEITTNDTRKQICLLCNESIAVSKEYNLRRHFNTKHSNFNTNYPEGSDARRQKVQSLTANYEQRRAILARSCSEQERTTTASLRVTWILAKKKKPFTDAETVKECMLAVLDDVVTDEKVKNSVITSIRKIPMSDTTTIRRVEALATDVFETLLDKLKKAEVMSLAVDESTDGSDVAELCLYVRFFDGECFREDLLGLIPLEGQTTGQIIFEKIVSFFNENGLDLQRVNMLATDGAPSMTGRAQGLSARLAALAPQMKPLHCLIHQAVLCAKLSGELKGTMDNIMSMINFIRATSSLQHRLFRKLLSDMSAEHSDLLVHNDIRWLSKGNALKRVCELRHEIIAFLRGCHHKKAAPFLAQMQDDEFMADVCFLSDIFQHLNGLNLQLQGRDKTVCDLVDRLNGFKRKLELFSIDLTPTKMLHFPTLRALINSSSAQISPAMTAFIDKLIDNFAARFDNFNIPAEVMRFTKDPFSVDAGGEFAAEAKQVLPSLDEGSLQLELIDIQASSDLKHDLRSLACEQFWVKLNQVQFPNTRRLAFFLLTMFGTTYTCESSFSHMNAIKTNTRASLTSAHLHQCLRIALTPYEPNFAVLAKSKKCHFSH